MTDDQFERIKKGLNFHSEGGVYNLCTLTETALRKIIEDAVKFYEKQQKIDAEHIRALQKQNGELTDELKVLRESIKDYGAGCYENGLRNGKKKLEAQIEILMDFVLSKTECCDVCPITDTCINSEGTCPYTGILAKGEEEVTREWLMQFISKEIKEK